MVLKGINVIEMAGLGPGPLCGKILADFGANVIQVDKVTGKQLFDVMSNGKRSFVVDLKSKQGVSIMRKLCCQADVLIEPFRSGVMERLGLGPSVLLKENPRLIYARLSGYGQNGYFAKMAGHDINYISLTGLLSLYGWRNSNPTPPVNFSEFAGGSLSCAFGIVLALFDRTRTNQGQVVDSNIVEGVAYIGSWLLKLQNMPGFWNPRGHNLLDGGSHFYDTYETKDGKFMAVGALEPQFYAQLLEKLNLDEETVPQQSEDTEKSRRIFAAKFKEKTQAEWCAIFDLSDACVTPVLTAEEAVVHRHNRDRNTFEKDEEGNVIVKPAPRLSLRPMRDTQAAPIFGQHTKEILLNLGYTNEQVNSLAADGVIEVVEGSKL